jgi:hypothetical protein
MPNKSDIGFYISLLIVKINVMCVMLYNLFDNVLYRLENRIPSASFYFLNLILETFRTIFLIIKNVLLPITFKTAQLLGIEIITIDE